MIPDGFFGLAAPRSPSIMAEIAAQLGCEKLVVETVVAIEARSTGFLPDRRPVPLYERHYFHRLTGGRYDRTDPDISNRTAGGYLGGSREYDRIARALDLDRDAALRSTSWGLGQIMGANHRLAGFETVEAFVEAMCRGEDDQLRAFASFVSSAFLADELRDKRWADFARGYNGPAYRRNAYDTRLATEYARRLSLARSGDQDRAQIAELQTLLGLAGYPITVDGWPGPKTTAAIKAFQRANGLAVDGIAGPKTLAELLATTGGTP